MEARRFRKLVDSAVCFSALALLGFGQSPMSTINAIEKNDVSYHESLPVYSTELSPVLDLTQMRENPAVISDYMLNLRNLQTQGPVRLILGKNLSSSNGPYDNSLYARSNTLANTSAVVTYSFANIQALEIELRSSDEDIFTDGLSALEKLLPYADYIQLLDMEAVKTFSHNEDVERIIDTDTANKFGARGRGQIVAVIDMGLDASHSAFSGGRVLKQICIASDQTCPNEQRIDTMSPNAAFNSESGGNLHGTGVSSIVTSLSEAGIWFYRIVKVSDIYIALDSLISASSTSVDIASVNMSLGWGDEHHGSCASDEPVLRDIFKQLQTANVLIALAAGNSGRRNGLNRPACISEFNDSADGISVVGSERDGSISASSNSDPRFVFLFAPTDVSVADAGSVPDGYSIRSGTSCASPQIAASSARLREMFPNLTVRQVESILNKTGSQIGYMDGSPHPGALLNVGEASRYVFFHHIADSEKAIFLPFNLASDK